MDERIFMPHIEDFKSEEDYKEYRENCRCGVCHKKLVWKDKFQLRPIQTSDEITGSFTVQAVIVHSKCIT